MARRAMRSPGDGRRDWNATVLFVADGARTQPETATLARLSGDEFAVLIPGADSEMAAHTAEQLLHALERPLG